VPGTLCSGGLASTTTIPRLPEINESEKAQFSAVNMSQMFLMGKLSQATGAYQYMANIAMITIMSTLWMEAKLPKQKCFMCSLGATTSPRWL